MKTTERTPGQWHLGDAHDCGKGLAVCSGAQVIARVTGFGFPVGIGNDPKSTANARLIAAAPDLASTVSTLLAHLRYALKSNPDCFGAGRAHVEKHVSEAESLLLKATGEAQ